MKTWLNCKGCLTKMLKKLDQQLIFSKSTTYLIKKHLKNTVISYKNKKPPE